MIEKLLKLKKLGLLVAFIGAAKPIVEGVFGIQIPNEMVNDLSNVIGIGLTIWGIWTNHDVGMDDKGDHTDGANE